MDDYSKFVPNVHFEQIPIKNLVSCQDYQRALSENHVKKASDNFDIYQINPVKVSRRDGINYVFNGQHTIEIVATVSGSRDTPVWCMIYDDLVYEHEADIFANQMKYVKHLLPYEIFNANVEAGNDKQLLIKDLVESFDLKISPSSAPGGICAVSSLEFIFDKYGFDILNRTLILAVGTWEGEPQSLSAGMLKGIAKFLEIYGDDVNDEVFKERLSRIPAKDIIRRAKERRPGSMGFVESLVLGYNKKARNALAWEKIYDSKARKASSAKNRKQSDNNADTAKDKVKSNKENNNSKEQDNAVSNEA